jgi:hypothetical protein
VKKKTKHLIKSEKKSSKFTLQSKPTRKLESTVKMENPKITEKNLNQEKIKTYQKTKINRKPESTKNKNQQVN